MGSGRVAGEGWRLLTSTTNRRARSSTGCVLVRVMGMPAVEGTPLGYGSAKCRLAGYSRTGHVITCYFYIKIHDY